MDSSSPTQSLTNLTSFNPNLIPYQMKVVNLIRRDWDYSKGNPEILLSGSYGCLKKDSLIETASGLVPICDITSQHYLLTFDEKSNRFLYQQGSGAYPKDKGTLYRVVSERGEFEASGNHLVATSLCNFVQVEDLSPGDLLLSADSDLSQKYLSADQRLFASGALRCFGIFSSLIHHYAKRIHQHGQSLRSDLSNVLSFFPLLNDAQAHGQFSCMNTHERMDDFLELGQELFRSAGSASLFYKLRSDILEGRPFSVLEDAGSLTISSEHTFESILQSLLLPERDDHPKVLLLNLYRICASFYASRIGSHLIPNDKSFCKVLSVQKMEKEEWYWDIQVPNTNNYVCEGVVHHNSAKSILMAHLAVTHCLFNPGAVALLARKALPDLKDTIYREILEHIQEDLVEGKDYWLNTSSAKITFSNGSEIMSRSWSDKKYHKGRSLKISFLVFEELTENNDEDKEAFMTLKARLRRLPHVKENVLIAATNPAGQSHWVYKYFFDQSKKSRFVFKSITTDNPFLDPVYIQQLKDDLDPIQAQRYIYGEWVDLNKDRVYYAYERERNFKEKFKYESIDELRICHDFNIGHNKPMSAAAAIKIDNVYHVIKAFHVEGARTNDIMEDIAASGLLDIAKKITVYGDASGKNRDTRSIKSDYDIIKGFLANYKTKDNRSLVFEIKVPLANPPIRRRHNLVNAYFINENKDVRLIIYDEWLHEGFMQTSFKKGADLIEDDSLPQQHVTTAIGYMIDYDVNRNAQQSKTIQL